MLNCFLRSCKVLMITCVNFLYRKLLNYIKETHPNFCQSSPKSDACLGSIFPSSNWRSIPTSPVGHTGTRRCHHLYSSYFLSEGRFPTDQQGRHSCKYICCLPWLHSTPHGIRSESTGGFLRIFLVNYLQQYYSNTKFPRMVHCIR
jgi:hypothetical protein